MADRSSVPTTGTTTSSQDPATAKPAAAATAATGAGVQALQALLARGAPKPAQVVALIDAHRSDRTAMFQLLQTTLGNGYVQQVVTAMNGLRVSIPNQEVAAGDPSNPSGGYFLASAKEKDARWQTASGNFSGKVDGTGATATEKLGANDDLQAKYDQQKKQGTLDWNQDGKQQVELFGDKTANGWDAGARKSFAVGGGTLTTTGEHSVAAGVATDKLDAAYAAGANKLDASAGVSQGKPVGGLDATHTFAGGSSVHGNATYNASGTTVGVDGTDKLANKGTLTGGLQLQDTPKGTSETLKAGYTDATTTVNANATRGANGAVTGGITGSHKLGTDGSINGSITRQASSTQLALGGAYNFDPQDSVNGSITETIPDHGASSTVLKGHQQHSSSKAVESLDVEAGAGAHDYAKATAGLDLQLAPNVYGGAWGTMDAEQGQKPMGSVGASITLTPDERNALTLAGIIRQDGAFETRLQWDIFQSKLDSVSTLSKEKKNALVSLFVSYTSKGTPGMLNDELGAPSYATKPDAGAVMAGIRIKF